MQLIIIEDWVHCTVIQQVKFHAGNWDAVYIVTMATLTKTERSYTCWNDLDTEWDVVQVQYICNVIFVSKLSNELLKTENCEALF